MKYKAVVSYFGPHYSGFQRQPQGGTVQDALENVLSQVFGCETLLKAAGRTDAGVHAYGQVISFEGKNWDDPGALRKAVNGLLPDDIYIRSIEVVPASFDARHSARGKVYQYAFTVNERDPLRSGSIAQLRRDDFKFEPFLRALRVFEGTHNFQSFTTKPEDKDGFIRTIRIREATLEEDGNYVRVVFEGNGFMRYQIRMMVGAALRVGLGKMSEDALRAILENPERNTVPYKAAPEGLCLLEVLYDDPAV